MSTFRKPNTPPRTTRLSHTVIDHIVGFMLRHAAGSWWARLPGRGVRYHRERRNERYRLPVSCLVFCLQPSPAQPCCVCLSLFKSEAGGEETRSRLVALLCAMPCLMMRQVNEDGRLRPKRQRKTFASGIEFVPRARSLAQPWLQSR